ncbi:hypothetical protein HMI54_003282 [Coelomomyces lativittatus]|nr:hypothetical protein HMI56_002556 [Coelomomyces lativittatus]KAJ1508359.1 hypothetical protein HMI54_003282 [Coelomomyces lativittatus]KAJ1516605.1 hypothetical protein HMI55_001855 [Coelomomyces lativittatus]
MAHSSRINASLNVIHHTPRVVDYPTSDKGKPLYLADIFGQYVFGTPQLQKALPKPVFALFEKQMRDGHTLDKVTADAVAHAVRVWAQDRGATHFTHWFQPQTGSTAEKHDSFLSLKMSGTGEVTPMDVFSGSQLLQSEPDASSFPSGGMRTTFEARGYTVWDTNSPMFIRPNPAVKGASTLYIPCVFISYHGQALDEKTILLRANEALAKAALKVLRLLGDTTCSKVFTTLGCEQEYFLIDRGLYSMRLDLKLTGRTLLGQVPPKHQQLEDHYFGKIPSRVLGTIAEAELELLKLGVPLKTRHNEVAPTQFEVAPIFEEASVAVDHNLLVMDVFHQVAHRHKLKVLFHEKPFKGVNGSGKHCNWSMCTDTGDNLLDPTAKPETNYRFLIFLLATLRGLHQHQGLLRAAIASASNEHRLGANEAPPGIMSAFLGEQLTEVLDAIEEQRPLKNFSKPHMQTIKLGGTVLDLKVSVLPEIVRDLTDRNRTSPFAFTGNKFEFRAVGSKQSPSFPVTMLTAAVASALEEVGTMLQATLKPNTSQVSTEALIQVIRQLIVQTKPIRFEGDNYHASWHAEAQKRGLLNLKSPPTCFQQLLVEANKTMLLNMHVFTEEELMSRYHVLLERYTKDVVIEANTLKTMLTQHVLPCVSEQRRQWTETVALLKSQQLDASLELDLVMGLQPPLTQLQKQLVNLDTSLQTVLTEKDEFEQASKANLLIRPIMDTLREASDALESRMPDKVWPFPKYTEMLFS